MKYLKYVFLLLIGTYSNSVYSQELINFENREKKSVLVINEKYYDYATIYGINKNSINSISREIKDGVEYLVINMKHTPNMESLERIIQQKGTSKLEEYMVIIDDRIILGNYKSIMVDKENIIKIEKENIIINDKEKDVYLIETMNKDKTVFLR